jgi:hypothetical protein
MRQEYNMNGIGSITISGSGQGLQWQSSRSILNYVAQESGYIQVSIPEFQAIESVVSEILSNPPEDKAADRVVDKSNFQFLWKEKGEQVWRASPVNAELDPKFAKLLALLFFKYATK